MAAPLYELNSVVYMADAAQSGRLESYTIVGVRQTSDGWYYRVSFPQRPPTDLQTMGDRITNKNGYDVDFDEASFCTLCEAITYAETYLNGQLSKIATLKAQFCNGSSSGS